MLLIILGQSTRKHHCFLLQAQPFSPIALFQAQPKNGKDFLNEEKEKSNVQKRNEKRIELKIPAE